MWDKAGEMRRKSKTTFVKGANLSVNLNSLLRQIREEGVVAVYCCPNCGGRLKVDKTACAEGLRACEHCGKEIQTIELAEFLRTVLS